MNPKADGWLFAVAVFAVAAVLFLPITTQELSWFPIQIAGPKDWASILTWFLTGAGFWAFQRRLWPADSRERRRFSCAIPLVLFQAILLRTAVELSGIWRPEPLWLPRNPWSWMPWFLIPGLTGILLGSRFAVLLCLTGTYMLYLLTSVSPLPLMGSFISALAGILVLRRAPSRIRVLRAGTAAGGILGLVGGIDSAMQPAALPIIGAAVVVPLLIGVFSAFLVLAVLPLFEWVLGELSDVSVIEYGTDHRLLDELRTKAPGTWYHCLNVADLAEKAAAQIGAGALFCRTAALYHDIGKLKEPGLFAENSDGPSLHDHLDPQQSAQKIIEHVAYGLELARKHRLPKPFRQIIAEHHGASVVRFFYGKACQLQAENSGAQVDRTLFCYPGPLPSTRESGIIALADAVEAASRSLPSGSDLSAFVPQLFAERLAEGQLAQCPLSLIDLARIQEAFIAWLKSRNHFRPAYPAAVSDTAVSPAKPISASRN
jgi:putative nucleotidyltransferase with HDIG domain